MSEYDALVVGAGPNGLAAAVTMARAGRNTLLVEAMDSVGGGTRTAELTLPGFHHDVCSAIHPSGIASPFFAEIGLEVPWVQSPIPFTHPLPGGRVAALYRSIPETAAGMGGDADTYTGLMEPIVDRIDDVLEDVLSPMTLNPKHKSAYARVAAIGALPAAVLATRFSSEEGKAIMAGLAAHSIAPFTAPATAAVGLLLGAIGHRHGWPMAQGGSQTIADALAADFLAHGGTIETGTRVDSLAGWDAQVTLLDLMPPNVLSIAGSRLSAPTQRRLSRWKPGPGVFKVDWALSDPIPWADPLSPRAATVHVGGTYSDVEAAERAVFNAEHPERPFVLLAQQSLFDPTRAPLGRHTAWGYCHVPTGSSVDMTAAIEAQIERFAPGFADTIIERHTRNTLEYQEYNPNIVGGDIGGGGFGLRKLMQMGAKRPYTLGNGLYLCSSATPPGAGIHGMCGHYAARAALD